MRQVKLLFGFMLLTTLSCCKVLFTQDIRDDLVKNNIDLKKIQYYNSQKIVLSRFLSSSETKVTAGEVKLEKGKYIEIIDIKKNTPGVCDSVSEDRLNIKFEAGPNKYITFKKANKYQGYYEMYADEWTKKNIVIPLSSEEDISIVDYDLYTGKVRYDSKLYYTKRYSTKPRLKIKKTGTTKTTRKVRKVKGMRVE